MKRHLLFLLVVTLTASHSALSGAGGEASARVPERAPRTSILAGERDAFSAYATTGAGAAAFAKIKADFDARCFDLEFPEEPVTYGDPAPSKRDSAKVDLWRGQQDAAGRIAAVAEAAALIWVVTGEERYLDVAREWLLQACRWKLDAGAWASGPVRGATDVYYNDEAHFRLWRKLPLVYDQIRDELGDGERKIVLDHFRERGRRSARWIRETGRIERLKRNSLEVNPSSHPVRFMTMTGLTGLALWDDLPEAREWWRFAYDFYRDQFTPWGGDDGGWAEGVAYWRGVIEHAAFQDALLAIGDPLAYANPFWRNTPYFQVYNAQPYRHTAFGDLSNAGRFNLEPVVADFLLHMARVTGDGHLVSYASLQTDTRVSPIDSGLGSLDRIYPNAAEFLVRNFIASGRPLPAAEPLSALPAQRFFSDVGWASMHSALGRPEEDIHITFVSSPYGSFSHSHAHQNAFILNAWGENLAIASGYREFHNSPHHDGWTRLTVSKNLILIDGRGQKPRDKNSTGRITRFDARDDAVWTTGDATKAHQLGNPEGGIERVTRDLVFVDRRYLVVRDVVRTREPSSVTWLLHAVNPIAWEEDRAGAFIHTDGATLTTRLLTPEGSGWDAEVKDKFSVPVDPKYARGGVTASWATGSWTEQSHLFARTRERSREHTIFAVLWPERGARDASVAIEVKSAGTDAIEIRRPDGRAQRITLTDTTLSID